MNGKDMPPDHGHPLHVLVPGYVGARQVKWLRRIVLSAKDSQAPWQQEDYQLLPPEMKDHTLAKWEVMPPVLVLPVQSSIMLPPSGSAFPPKTRAIKCTGYAWSGDGVPIIRVDVTANGGNSWKVAKITNQRITPAGKAWAWVFWEAQVEVPSEVQEKGGVVVLQSKAMDMNSNSQPENAASVWNFRGLCCNSWGTSLVRVEGSGKEEN